MNEFSKPIFTTERLAFYVLGPESVLEFLDLCRQPGLATFGSDTYAKPTEEKSRRFISEQIESFQNFRIAKFGVRLRANQKLIGISGVFKMDSPFDSEYEINYRFIKSEQGKGHSQEAARAVLRYGFLTLNLSKIHARISPQNTPSKNLIQKVGMKFSTTSKEEEIWLIERNDYLNLIRS